MRQMACVRAKEMVSFTEAAESGRGQSMLKQAAMQEASTGSQAANLLCISHRGRESSIRVQRSKIWSRYLTSKRHLLVGGSA